MRRYLSIIINEDLKQKMVFLAGPRQVGKTTVALSFLIPSHEENPAYLNWDFPKSRKRIRDLDLPPNSQIIVFDELHKYARWRNLIKGAYDQYKSRLQFIVTGSAKLDFYSRGGDSLLGRYHLLRLHPFSLPETAQLHPTVTLTQLFDFGGFPEPLFRKDKRFSRRWSADRKNRITADDINSLEKLKELSLMELLIEALPARIGAPLSYANLAQDLEIAPRTAKRWVDILERVYYCFRLAPFGPPKIRAVKKENKLYLWDWSEIEDPGIRFENFVASHLLKYCHFIEDTEGHRMELRYLRDTDQREVDFVVLKDRKPMFAVECKLTKQSISPHLRYYRERTKIPLFFQVFLDSQPYHSGNEAEQVAQVSFQSLCEILKLV